MLVLVDTDTDSDAAVAVKSRNLVRAILDRNTESSSARRLLQLMSGTTMTAVASFISNPIFVIVSISISIRCGVRCRYVCLRVDISISVYRHAMGDASGIKWYDRRKEKNMGAGCSGIMH